MLASAVNQSNVADQFRPFLPFRKSLASAISKSRWKSSTVYPALSLARIALFLASDIFSRRGYDPQTELYNSQIVAICPAKGSGFSVTASAVLFSFRFCFCLCLYNVSLICVPTCTPSCVPTCTPICVLTCVLFAIVILYLVAFVAFS